MIIDVSVTNPLSASYVEAVAQCDGALNQHNSQMVAAVAGFVLRRPGREWRRPCAPPCEIGVCDV